MTASPAYFDRLPLRAVFILLFALFLGVLNISHRGIEILRIPLFTLSLFFIFKTPEMRQGLKQCRLLQAMALFFAAAAVSLWVNGFKVTESGRIFNWLMCFVIGFTAASLEEDDVYAYFTIIPVSSLGFFLYVLLRIKSGAVSHEEIFPTGRLYLYSNPNNLAVIYGIGAIISAGVFLKEKRRILRITSFFAALSGLGLLLLTRSRMALIAFALVSVSSLWVYLYAVTGRRRIFLLASALLLTFSLALGGLFCSQKLENYLKNDVSFRIRLFTWGITIDEIKAKYPTGAGFSKYKDFIKPRFDAAFDRNAYGQEVETFVDNAHNYSLHVLAETGIAGFLALSAFFALSLYHAFAAERKDPMAGYSILYALLCLQMSMNLYMREISTLVFLLAGVGYARSLAGNRRSQFLEGGFLPPSTPSPPSPKS